MVTAMRELRKNCFRSSCYLPRLCIESDAQNASLFGDVELITIKEQSAWTVQPGEQSLDVLRAAAGACILLDQYHLRRKLGQDDVARWRQHHHPRLAETNRVGINPIAR